jgi:hypothetical protein
MQLYMAAYGWSGEAWSAFYPDDLPREWRLDYYANEYDAVVVPREEWLAAGDERLVQWLGEVPQGFRFYWEFAGSAEAQRLCELYRSLQDSEGPAGWLQVGGMVLPPATAGELAERAPLARCDASGECHGNGLQTICPNRPTDLRQLRRQLDAAAAAGTESLLLVVRPSPQAEQELSQLQVLCQLYGG